jgi:phosphoribosylformimino-5-aminoimidazole carboxamide ribotide isomerase
MQINSFQLIPVIDLMGGQVVHAKLGNRKEYKPIQSQLCSSSNPLDILTAFMKLYPFTKIYIADLDAIQNNEPKSQSNYKTIELILDIFPNLEIWLDAGIYKEADISFWQKLNPTHIIPSEKFTKIDNYIKLTSMLSAPFVLSLDFLPDGYKGPSELLKDTNLWPSNVIMMSLPDVGSNQGPNFNLLNQMLQTNSLKIYAAGGIRNIADIKELIEIGVKGALVSTALHNEQISPADIEALNNKKARASSGF